MNTDGNMAALDRYMREQEQAEQNYEYVIEMSKNELRAYDKEFHKLLDEYGTALGRIKDELEERGLANENENVLEVVSFCTGDDSDAYDMAKHVMEAR